MKEKDKKPFLSMADVEEAVKKKMDELYNPVPKQIHIKLLKQQIYTEVISVWEIDGQFIETTQTSQGKYLLYKISEKEVKEWDNYSHFSGELNDKCANVGEGNRVLTGEWGQHNETGK